MPPIEEFFNNKKDTFVFCVGLFLITKYNVVNWLMIMMATHLIQWTVKLFYLTEFEFEFEYISEFALCVCVLVSQFLSELSVSS